jgi:single-strand selective monofunctional uracil DNA glycosylase
MLEPNGIQTQDFSNGDQFNQLKSVMTIPKDNVLKDIASITDDLILRLGTLTFSDPVTHIYNPLIYARAGYDQYVTRFGNATKRMIWVGMNPGPFGMVQTGIPFGDVQMVKGWMGIEASIKPPADCHPKRPVLGFACPRGEVSGQRLWGWARQRYNKPDVFFGHIFVINYCPLVFMERSGRNRTPDKLQVAERKRLFQICDRALHQTLAVYQPQWVIGIGGFAEKRIRQAAGDLDLKIGRISHPSPANPKANRGWGQLIESELAAMGVEFYLRAC